MPVADEGFETAEQRAEEAKTSAFYKIPFLKIVDGEQKPVFIRFVDPHIYTFAVHGGIPTKAKPDGVTGTWPDKMWGICQNDKPFRLRDPDGGLLDEFEPGYGDCHIHKIMKGIPNDKGYKGFKDTPRTQSYGLAVLCEPVRDPSTKAITGFRDLTEEFKTDEGTFQAPKLVIAQQTYSNFWAPLKAQTYMGSGRITDWVFGITRKENDYAFSARETPDVTPDTPAWKKYADALALTGTNLWDILIGWSSPDWYKRWFIEGATPEGGYGSGKDDAAEDAAAATASAGQPSPEAVGSFAEELRAARSGASA